MDTINQQQEDQSKLIKNDSKNKRCCVPKKIDKLVWIYPESFDAKGRVTREKLKIKEHETDYKILA